MPSIQELEPVISIGDLVTLKDDKQMIHGIGLVLDKRDDTADIIREFVEQLGIKEDDKEINEAMQAANDYLLNTSVFLVHWQGGKNSSPFRNIWMFYSEIELLSKVETSVEAENGEQK
jgi:hypothetical protein